MEDWKITLAEGMISHSKYDDKSVKIKTKDNKTGKAVAQAISTGVAAGKLSADFKGMSKSPNSKKKWYVIAAAELLAPGVGGLAVGSTMATQEIADSGWKVFYCHTGSGQAQTQLNNNLDKVVAEVNEYKNAQARANAQRKALLDDNKKLVIAVAVIVAALVWALWK